MKNILLVGSLGMCFAVSAANVWYADAVNGNDAWDGKADFANADPASNHGPKQWLADFTTLVGAGDTIYVAPGHYTNRTSATATNFRFYTSVGNISLIATGSAADTFIEGSPDPDKALTTSPYGCGPKAVAPIKMLGGNNLVKGFTIANGRQVDWATYGGGAFFNAATDRMADCVVTNCAAARGGGVNNLGHALRCRFTGNYADEGSHALSMVSAVNCVFENTDKYAVYNGNAGGTFINCTCRGNKTGNFRTNGGPIYVYNSVFTKVSETPKNKNCAFYNCVFDYDPTIPLFASEAIYSTNAECRVVATGTVLLNADATPTRSGGLAEAAVADYYDDNFPSVWDAAERGFDVDRRTRMVGEKMDIGAAERPAGGTDDNEWFVDAVNGDNSRSGKTPDLAKKSLVAIMEGRVKGDVVYAAPGVYSNDTVAVGSQLYRVKIPAGVQLVGSEGAEKTVILGKVSETPDSTYGTGPGAIACAYCAETDVNANWVAIRGFTLSGGCTESYTGDYSYGAAFRGAGRTAGIMTDCVITNCMSGRGPVYNFGYVIRCRFYDNLSVEGAGGAVLDVHGVYDSYFTRSRTGVNGSGNIMHDIYQSSGVADAVAVNCTFEGDGTCGPHAAGANRTLVYNSIIKSTSDAGGVWYHNCVNTAKLESAPSGNGSDKDEATIITNAAAVALSVETYTPVAGVNPAVGKGDYTFYTNRAPACIREHIGKDLWGKPRLVNGRLDVGAVACDRSGARVADASTGLVVTGLDVAKDGLWHDVESVASFTVSRDFSASKFVRGFYLEGVLVDFNAHADDWTYEGMLPADGSVEILAYYPVVNDWYVDANNGNDDNDGLTPSAAHAFKTLARASTNAVLLASGEKEMQSTIYVAEGLYNTGIVPANFGGLSNADNSTDNRLYVHWANYVATGRREETIIEGASSSETECGIGVGAVRCCLMRGGSLRGFTLRGGNVNANPSWDDRDQGGGIRSTSTEALAYDCEIYGCNAVRGGGAQGLRLVRCYVHDNTCNVGDVAPTRKAQLTDVYGCAAYNTVVKGPCYTGGPFVNCTLLGTCWGNGTTFVNCYIGADGAAGEAVAAIFTNCVCATAFKSFTPHDGCLENTPCTFDENWRPKRRLSPLVDAGDLDLYDAKFPSALSAYRDLDFAGGPRVIKQTVETIDIGAGERPYTEPQGVLLLVR